MANSGAQNGTYTDNADMPEKSISLLEKIEMDENWVKFLPEGSSINSAAVHATSAWATSARIEVVLASGEVKVYFLKLAKGENGRGMVKGEFESMQAFYALSKNMIPRPIGFGTYSSNDDCHFFLAEFIDLVDDVPNIAELGRQLAELHFRSIPASPSGKFGFGCTTYNGRSPHDCSWTDTWEEFCIRALKHTLAYEAEAQGPSEEIDTLASVLYAKVVPRLIRPMETGGRILKPCLVHGDFWDGNTAFNAETGQIYVFDAGAFWGHNEYDLAACSTERSRLGRLFIKEYFKHFPVTPPEEDWEGRNLLYTL